MIWRTREAGSVTQSKSEGLGALGTTGASPRVQRPENLGFGIHGMRSRMFPLQGKENAYAFPLPFCPFWASADWMVPVNTG